LATYPRTLFLTEGELDYDFDFSEDFTIYAGGTYDLSATPQYIDNQTFNCNRSGSFSAAINKIVMLM
jgi:hypothetical protein